eukprot:c23768_g1_i1 orf=206-2689(+)
MAVLGDIRGFSACTISSSSLQPVTSNERRGNPSSSSSCYVSPSSPLLRTSSVSWTPALSKFAIEPSPRYTRSSYLSRVSERQSSFQRVVGLGLGAGLHGRYPAHLGGFHGIRACQDSRSLSLTQSFKKSPISYPVRMNRLNCHQDSSNNYMKRHVVSTVVACAPGDGANIQSLESLGEKNGHCGLPVDDADGPLPESDRSTFVVSKSQITGSEKEEVSFEQLKGKLQSALEELDLARLNSSKIEEDAQAITERAIALRDEATDAEARAENAAAMVNTVSSEELLIEDLLSKARALFAEAEARVLLAESALRQAKESLIPIFAEAGVDDVVESASMRSDITVDSSEEIKALKDTGDIDNARSKSLDEISTLSKEEKELGAAEAELKAYGLALAQYEADLLRIKSLKTDLQKEASGLAEAAKVAREIALEADEEVNKVMLLAEQAVALEVDAAQRVCIAEIALQKTEKLASEAAHSDATLAGSQGADSVSIPADELQRESPAESDKLKARELSDNTNGHEAQVSEKRLEFEQTLPVSASFESVDVIDDAGKTTFETLKVEVGVFQESQAEKVKTTQQQKKETVKEASPAGVPKSSTKKSSRFFSASYFSFNDDDKEFSPTTIFQGIKQHFLKVSVGVLLLCGGSLLLKNRMESQPQLAERTEFVASFEEVTSSAQPIVRELRRLPKRVQSILEKIPHQEVNEEEASLFDVIWLLLASVIFVPIFQKLPGGSPVLGYLAAGVLIGPYSLSIIRHVHGTKAIAEFGVVFLLFNIGLELSVERLSSMKKYVFGLGTAQVFVTALVVGLVSHYICGFSGPAALVVGNGLALSS